MKLQDESAVKELRGEPWFHHRGMYWYRRPILIASAWCALMLAMRLIRGPLGWHAALFAMTFAAFWFAMCCEARPSGPGATQRAASPGDPGWPGPALRVLLRRIGLSAIGASLAMHLLFWLALGDE